MSNKSAAFYLPIALVAIQTSLMFSIDEASYPFDLKIINFALISMNVAMAKMAYSNRSSVGFSAILLLIGNAYLLFVLVRSGFFTGAGIILENLKDKQYSLFDVLTFMGILATALLVYAQYNAFLLAERSKKDILIFEEFRKLVFRLKTSCAKLECESGKGFDLLYDEIKYDVANASNLVSVVDFDPEVISKLLEHGRGLTEEDNPSDLLPIFPPAISSVRLQNGPC
jgi:hypothetical protein